MPSTVLSVLYNFAQDENDFVAFPEEENMKITHSGFLVT